MSLLLRRKREDESSGSIKVQVEGQVGGVKLQGSYSLELPASKVSDLFKDIDHFLRKKGFKEEG